jgi:hypothetical protein
VIHAALVEVKDGLAAELSEFALKELPLILAAFAVFYEFFLASSPTGPAAPRRRYG